MTMSKMETIQASGNLEIIKIYNDGNEETIFSDHNTITHGLGASFATIFAGAGVNIKNHQIRWFQLGTGLNSPINSSMYQLSTPLAAGDYGSTVKTDTHQLAGLNFISVGDRDFAWIPQTSVRKTSNTSVTYTLSIDSNSCNNKILQEIGLFVHNPYAIYTGSAVRSALAAYKSFSPITKTDEFSLLFRWKLSF